MAEQTEVSTEFRAVFAELKPILQSHVPPLVAAADEPSRYYLNTTQVMQNKQALFFGGVEIKKNYVSFHLFPVYTNPELLDTLSPALRARMQGKACFNFKKRDSVLMAELAQLTQAGFAAFQDKGWIKTEPYV